MNGASKAQFMLHSARRAAVGFDFAPVSIEPMRILRMHGYRDFATVRRRVRGAAEAMAQIADQILQPVASVRCLSFLRADPGVLQFDDGVQLRCDAFEHYLRDCDEVVLFVLSAGVALDAQIARFMDDSQPVDALFLNTAGWLSVEMMTRQLAGAIKLAALDERMRPTRRMGPGYSYRLQGVSCSWPLPEQRELFALLGQTPPGVTLLASGGMQPQMSRSGLFGLRRL